MKKTSLTALGETEMEVLHHVWELGEATVADVHARVLQDRQVAYTTVMTVLKNLHRKGYLAYRRDGASYVYRAARAPETVQHGLLQTLIDKVFKGSPSALVQTLVRHEPLSDAERDALRAWIDAADELDDEPGAAIPDAEDDDDRVA